MMTVDDLDWGGTTLKGRVDSVLSAKELQLVRQLVCWYDNVLRIFVHSKFHICIGIVMWFALCLHMELPLHV